MDAAKQQEFQDGHDNNQTLKWPHNTITHETQDAQHNESTFDI